MIYHNDALAREQKLSPAERPQFHQDQSGPVMTELHIWLRRSDQESTIAAGRADWGRGYHVRALEAAESGDRARACCE